MSFSKKKVDIILARENPASCLSIREKKVTRPSGPKMWAAASIARSNRLCFCCASPAAPRISADLAVLSGRGSVDRVRALVRIVGVLVGGEPDGAADEFSAKPRLPADPIRRARPPISGLRNKCQES